MAEEGYILSPEDYETLKDMVREYRQDSAEPNNRPSEPPRRRAAHETYLAKIPAGGIAGLELEPGTGTGSTYRDGDIVQSAVCDIYRMFSYTAPTITKRLAYAGFNRIVHNASYSDLIAGSYTLVHKDKFGVWWAGDEQGDGGTTPGDCDADLTWVSNVCINWAAEEVTVQYITRNGCTGQLIEWFNVVNPGDCESEGVLTECCPDIQFENLCATFSGCTGGLAFLNSSEWNLFWDAAEEKWFSDYVCESDVGVFYRLIFYCLGSVFKLDFGLDTEIDPDSATCEPIDIVFPVTNDGLICGGSAGTGTVTIAVCTSPGTGTGSGTGGGGLTGPNVTSCCPAGLPNNLYCTLSGGAGCSVLYGTYLMVWGGSSWVYSAALPACSGTASLSITYSCTGGHWQLVAVVNDGMDQSVFTFTHVNSCDYPMSMGTASATTGMGFACCSGSVAATISG